MKTQEQNQGQMANNVKWQCVKENNNQHHTQRICKGNSFILISTTASKKFSGFIGPYTKSHKIHPGIPHDSCWLGGHKLPATWMYEMLFAGLNVLVSQPPWPPRGMMFIYTGLNQPHHFTSEKVYDHMRRTFNDGPLFFVPQGDVASLQTLK